MDSSTDVDALLARIAKEEGKSKSRPGCWYSRDGDCIFCFADDVDFYAERVDKVLTIYRAEEDDRIIGVEVKEISKLPKHDGIAIELKTAEGVEVVTLILASAKASIGVLPPQSKAAYFDALSSMVGRRISSKQLSFAGKD